MKPTTEKFFVKTLEKNIGNDYRINASSDDGTDFKINSGIIESVYVENETVFLKLEGQDSVERFTIERISNIEVNNYDNMFKINYKDKTYFKIFIS